MPAYFHDVGMMGSIWFLYMYKYLGELNLSLNPHC